MFVASGPAIATSTRRIGLPPMEVLSSVVSDRHGTYVFRLPPSKTIPTRVRKEWEALLEFLSMDDPVAPPPDRQPATLAGRSLRSEFARDAWGLTGAEMRVLELLVKGHTNKEIAEAVGVVEGTVEAHVGAILKKASASNRTMLVYRYWTLETDGFQ
jgi:DNA-binding CsgD family transcriptional regulator